MNKIKKVLLLTLGGALGGMVGGVFDGIIHFLRVYFCNQYLHSTHISIGDYFSRSSLFFPPLGGALIGLGVSLGVILIPTKNSVLKVISQIVITGLIMFVFAFIGSVPFLLKHSSQRHWDSCFPYKPIYLALASSSYLAILGGLVPLGINILKRLIGRVNLLRPHILARTIVSILIAFLCFWWVFPMCKVGRTYYRQEFGLIILFGSISFGIILFSSLFKIDI